MNLSRINPPFSISISQLGSSEYLCKMKRYNSNAILEMYIEETQVYNGFENKIHHFNWCICVGLVSGYYDQSIKKSFEK